MEFLSSAHPSVQFDLSATPETEAIRDAIRALTRRLRALDVTAPDVMGVVPPELRRSFRDMGLLAPMTEDVGGSGIPDHLMWAVIAEELAAGDGGAAYDLVAGAHAWLFLDACGSNLQKRRFAELAVAPSSSLGTVFYHEGYGRGPSELATTAYPDGDTWVLSGRKIACIRAAEAEFAVIVARDGDELRAFAVALGELTGVRVVRDDATTGGLGLRAARMATVELNDVAVPATAVLHAGQGQLHRSVSAFRLATASVALGVATAALTYAAEYASEREAFGQSISAFQGVSFPLAEVDLSIDAARLHTWALLSTLDQTTDSAALDLAVSEVVALATATAVRAAVVGVNSLGGHGFLMDHPQERAYRDAGVLAALDFDVLRSNWNAVPTA